MSAPTQSMRLTMLPMLLQERPPPSDPTPVVHLRDESGAKIGQVFWDRLRGAYGCWTLDRPDTGDRSDTLSEAWHALVRQMAGVR